MVTLLVSVGQGVGGGEKEGFPTHEQFPKLIQFFARFPYEIIWVFQN